MTLAVLAGTRKGLFVLQGDEGRRGWRLEGPVLEGWEVNHAVVDPRDGTVHAATNHPVYGGTVHRSTDGGRTWSRSEGIGLPESSGLTLEKTWHVEPGRPDEPGQLWLGAAPGALLVSNDRGETWTAVAGIIEQPTRERWQPGAGGMCCHSIQLDPADPARAYVGISAAGAFRSDDGAGSFEPINTGVLADFAPEPYPEVGQCVHKLLLHRERPDRLWQQNHCGVYRSDDRGSTWERLDTNGLPSAFGFGLALHARDPDSAWVCSMVGPENRVVAGGKLGVYHTADGGATWELSAAGLPSRAWTGVLREGMASDELDPVGVYVGTQSGSVFASADEGRSWSEIASQLPPVLSVEVGVWRS